MRLVDRRPVAACVVLLVSALGCASSPPQSTNLTASDFDYAAREMVNSLAGDEFLTGRTPASPPVVIVTEKVENLTNDIIPPAEQWMTIAQVQNALPMRQFSQQRNVKFVLPPERRAMAEKQGLEVGDAGGLTPTHVMTAKFTSSRRAVDSKEGHVERKQDYYYIEFNLTDVQSREIVWSDSVEFKREARGLLID